MDMSDVMEEGAEEFEARTRAGLDELRTRFGETDQLVRDTVNAYPLATLFGVVLAGYVIGRLVSRYV